MTAIHKKQLVAALLALLVLIPVLLMMYGGALSVYAATSYSDVLQDLRTDETFNPEDYPDNKDDNGLQVIQIAESTDRELLVYVYQPAAKTLQLTATSIRISTTGDKDNPKPQDYKLTLLSLSGVFGKYRVDGFGLKNDLVRYYDVICIFRSWNPILDDGAENDNTISEVPDRVGKCFSAFTLNGKVVYNCTTTDVVEITDKHVGRVRLGNGLTWNGMTDTDAHFVAFSCDYDIERLFEADVEFSTQPFETTAKGTKLGEVTPQTPKELKYDKKTIITANNWFGHSYEWYEIETVEQFLSYGFEFSEEVESKLKKQQYVLRFYESVYNSGADGNDVLIGLFLPLGFIWTGVQNSTKCSGTLVSDVSVLRLKFEADGTVYNLGAVDNKQTGKNDTSPTTSADNMPWWVWLLVAVGVVAAVLILICIFVPGAAPAIGKGILTGLWWLISAPAQIVKSIAAAAERRKATAAAKSTTRKKAGKKKK